MRVVHITEEGEFRYDEVDIVMLRSYPTTILSSSSTGMEYIIFYGITTSGRITEDTYREEIPLGDAFIVGRIFDVENEIYMFVEPDIQNVISLLYANMTKQCPQRRCIIL